MNLPTDVLQLVSCYLSDYNKLILAGIGVRNVRLTEPRELIEIPEQLLPNITYVKLKKIQYTLSVFSKLEYIKKLNVYVITLTTLSVMKNLEEAGIGWMYLSPNGTVPPKMRKLKIRTLNPVIYGTYTDKLQIPLPEKLQYINIEYCNFVYFPFLLPANIEYVNVCVSNVCEENAQILNLKTTPQSMGLKKLGCCIGSSDDDFIRITKGVVPDYLTSLSQYKDYTSFETVHVLNTPSILTDLKIDFQCGDLLELPKSLKKIHIRDQSDKYITVNLPDCIEVVKITCDKIVFHKPIPKSVRKFYLNSTITCGLVFSGGMKKIHISTTIKESLLKIPVVETASLNVCGQLDIPYGIKKLSLFKRSYPVTIPESVVKLSVKYAGLKKLDVMLPSRLKCLKLIFARVDTPLPNTLERVCFLRCEILTALPDNIKYIYLESDKDLPNIPKKLKMLCKKTALKFEVQDLK